MPITITNGTVINGKYRVLHPLGAGGFGAVYLCQHQELDKPVALKLLQLEAESHAEYFARFEREAKALAKLKHRNIVACYEYGSWHGVPYLVMEYAEGRTLESELNDATEMYAPRILSIIDQVCAAIACAHAHGIIHRDLKPSNILLVATDSLGECVKIIDFGLARVKDGMNSGMQKLTSTGVALGSYLYLSPEECYGVTADERSDIYSMGCIFYQCLTGKHPMDERDPELIMHRHVAGGIPPIQKFSANLQAPAYAALCDAINKCLELNPDDRHQTVNEIRQALSHVNTQQLPEQPLWDSSSRLCSPSETRKAKADLRLVYAVCALFLLAILGFGFIYGFKRVESFRGAARAADNSLALFTRATRSSSNLHDVVMNIGTRSLLERALLNNTKDHGLDSSAMLKATTQVVDYYQTIGDHNKVKLYANVALSGPYYFPYQERVKILSYLLLDIDANGSVADRAAAVALGKKELSSIWINDLDPYVKTGVFVNFVETCIGAGDFEDAERYLSKVDISSASSDWLPQLDGARLRIAIHSCAERPAEQEKFEKCVERVLQQHPSDWNLAYHGACTAVAYGQWHLAELCLQHLHPHSPCEKELLQLVSAGVNAHTDKTHWSNNITKSYGLFQQGIFPEMQIYWNCWGLNSCETLASERHDTELAGKLRYIKQTLENRHLLKL